MLTEAEHAQKCYQDPAFWLEAVTGCIPTDQQRSLMDAIAYPGAHVAVASAHGTGKSFSLAAISLWFLATREDATIPCTAPTAHQLEDILWFEIRRLIDKMSPWMKKQFVVTKDKVTMIGSNGQLLARTARPEKPDALQGFHNENLLFVLDEAAAIDEKVYEVAHGTLSTPKARVIATGNPTLPRGFFYKIFHNENKWTKLYFSALDSPLVDPHYPKIMELDYGLDSDVYRIRVLGQFPLSGKNAMIPRDIIEKALKHQLKPNEVDQYGVVLGVDPAWEGDDRSVIALRQGRYAKILFAKAKMTGDELAREVIRQAKIYNASYIFIDKAGVGASCCDFLKVYGMKHVRVYFDMAPDDKQFMNKRAEMWWRIRLWMEQNDVMLTDHPGLREDLMSPEYGVRDNGKTFMESKRAMRKRGIRSPDLGDALALTFFLPYDVTVRKRSAAGISSTSVVEDFRSEWRRVASGNRKLFAAM